MASVEDAVKKINQKVGFLSYLCEENDELLRRKDQKEIERQFKVYETMLDEIQELKIQIQELKLEAGDGPAEVRKWRNELEGKLKDFLPIITGMKIIIENFKDDAKRRQNQAELELEKLKFEQRLQLETKLVELKEKSSMGEKPVTAVKLPKLCITKFKGLHLDCFRFWN